MNGGERSLWLSWATIKSLTTFLCVGSSSLFVKKATFSKIIGVQIVLRASDPQIKHVCRIAESFNYSEPFNNQTEIAVLIYCVNNLVFRGTPLQIRIQFSTKIIKCVKYLIRDLFYN